MIATTVVEAQEAAAPPSAQSPAAAATDKPVGLPPLSVEATSSKPKKAKAKSKSGSQTAKTAPAPSAPSPTPSNPYASPPGIGAAGGINGIVATASESGTKTDTPLIEIPQSISVITPDQLRDQAPRAVQEAAQYTAGVVTGSYGYDPRFDSQMILRGFSASPFLDGMRLVGYDFASFRNEVYGIGRIDIIKGPVSVLYGQNDVAGIFNIESKRPTATPLHEIELQAGSYDRYQGAFDLSGPLDAEGKLLYRLTGVYRDSDTELPHIEDDRKFIAPALTWRPTAGTTLTILGSYQEDETGPFDNYTTKLAGQEIKPQLDQIGALPFVNKPNLWNTYVDSYYGDTSFNRFDQTQYRVGYEFEQRIDDIWTVRQNLRYTNVDVLYNYVTIPGVSATLPDLLAGRLILQRQGISFDENIGAFTVDNQVQAKFTTDWLRHTFLMGVDYLRSDWSSIRATADASDFNLLAPMEGATFDPLSVKARQARQTSQLGFYAQDQIKAGQSWIVTLGVRHDAAESTTEDRLAGTSKDTDDQAVTGRAGLTYLAGNGLAPYISWSTSFLPNTGADYVGNPFEPTTGQQYEAGIKYQPLGWNALFTLAGYEITKQNVPTIDPDPAHIIINPNAQVQTGEVTLRGIEVEGRAELGYGWRALGAFAYQDMEITADNDATTIGNRPAFIPRYMASGWLDYTIPHGFFANLGANFGVRYKGSFFGDDANTVINDAVTLYDAGIHYQLDNWRFSVNASNLFDKEYVSCSGTETTVCYESSRRQVISKLSYRW